MLTNKVRLTYEDYAALGDEQRYELLDGDLYMVPAPGWFHQIVSRNIEFVLWPFVKQHQLGTVVDAPVDVVLSLEDVVQPDLVYIAHHRRHIITEKNVRGAPDLIVEVLSPTSLERDKLVKRTLYEKHGVREYWIVDPVGKWIEVLRLGEAGYQLHGVFFEHDTLTSPLLPSFALPLSIVFQPE